MTRLLDKPLKAFATYALMILAVSIPVYAWVVDLIWISELDESNALSLQHSKQKLISKEFSPEEIEQINQLWGELQPGISIVKTEGKAWMKDSVYEVIKANRFEEEDEADRFRALTSYIEIKGQGYLLSIETNVEETDETFGAIALVTLFFFLILIVGFILLNRRIATKTWSAFNQTLRSLHSFELSRDIQIQLPPTDILEFQELNQSIHQLVKNNVEVYQQQKSFTENASHELQTPIALLKSKLDLLIQQRELSPEVSALVSGIEAPLSRLSRINKNLLVLSKVESRQFGEIERLDVKSMLDSSLDLFEDYIQEKELQLDQQVQNSIWVQSNSFLLETLLHNLLSNSIRHTAIGGQIVVLSEDQSIHLKNSGKSSLDPKHLFERFSSHSQNKVSSGLGLAIIKEIAHRYQWQVNYHFEDGFHCFSVRFK